MPEKPEVANHYSAQYGQFADGVHEKVRRAAFGEDIGQNSWLTASELEGFAAKAGFDRSTELLEIGCGSGGPALHLARRFGLSVTGIDINEAGISAANAAAEGLGGRARFFCHDGGNRLELADQSFNAAAIFDAINHIPDREALLSQLHRLLRPGGILLFTDPVVITGPVTAVEIAARSSIGHFVFVPPGENERMLKRAGFELLSVEDATANTALISSRWIAARKKWRVQLIARDGEDAVDGAIRFSQAVHALSSSRRLSRFMYLARKP